MKRRITCERIENRGFKIGGFHNPSSIPIIEQYGKEHGYNFQHAENGGEYQIPDTRFCVDGYDKDKNVVIEYYEKRHKYQKEKDERRKQKIIDNNGIVKKRYVDSRSNQMVLRVDEHDFCSRINSNTVIGVKDNTFLPKLGNKTYIDAIIISDYCKGFLEEDDIQYICENNKNVFVDTKKQLGDWIKSADFIKINELEYQKNHELLLDDGVDDKLIVTLGSKGCRYKDKVFSVEEVPVNDVSGAGDTFIVGLVKGYLETNNIKSAIQFAQKCTNIVVQKHGVETVTLEEIQNG